MPFLERMHPETPCQPAGAHHPHRMVCSDPDEDDCWGEWRSGKYEPYNLLACCVCGQDWPCETKQAHHPKETP